jgi:P27 family predicted phage terminase small subunit
LKLLKGVAPGKDCAGRPVPLPPNFDRAAPEPPTYFKGEALLEWNRVVTCLDSLDLLKPADYSALVRHCELWETYRSAMDEVRATGITVVNPETGNVRKNPALTVVEVVGNQLLNSCREFGLTPSSEQRLPGSSKRDQGGDPFADSAAQA